MKAPVSPHGLPSGPVSVLGTRRPAGAHGQTRLGYAHTCAVVSTHPISKMDLLFFTARARHFPPSLVIWFFPSLQRELSPCQPPAGRGLSHPHPQHRAPLVPLGGVAFLWHPQQLCLTLPLGRTQRPEETSQDSAPGDGNNLQKLSDRSGPRGSLNDRRASLISISRVRRCWRQPQMAKVSVPSPGLLQACCSVTGKGKLFLAARWVLWSECVCPPKRHVPKSHPPG